MIARSAGIPKFKVVIMDEFSMITTELFFRFITTFTHDYHIIFVGDIYQLPPITWGSLAYQIIHCKRIPTYYLTVNHRITTKTELVAAPVVIGDAEAPEAPPQYDSILLANANALIAEGRNMKMPIRFQQGPGFYQYPGDVSTVMTVVRGLYHQGITSSQMLPSSTWTSSVVCGA